MSAEHRGDNSTNTGPKMCKNGCGLHGNVVLDGMCFRCFESTFESSINRQDSTSSESDIDSLDIDNTVTGATNPTSSRRTLKLSIPLRCAGEGPSLLSPAVSLVSNCSGRMTPVSNMSSPILSPMLLRPPSRLEFASQGTPSPTYCRDLRRFALNSGRLITDVETRRHTDTVISRPNAEPADIGVTNNDGDRIVIDVRSPSPIYTSDFETSVSSKCSEDGDERKQSGSCLGDKTAEDYVKFLSRFKSNRLKLDMEKASRLSESPRGSSKNNDHDAITTDLSTNSLIGSLTTGVTVSPLLSSATTGVSVSSLLGSDNELRLSFPPSIPDLMSPRFIHPNQSPDAVSPEPDFPQAYAYVDNNIIVDNYYNDSYSDIMSDNHMAYQNARRAEYLDLIRRANPDLYYQHLTEQDINTFLQAPDYINLTVGDYFRYLSPRDPVSTRSDVKEHNDLLSALYGTDKEKKNKKKRCDVCRKKVGLTGFDCRCGGHYCSLHRYSDTHECTFDYIEHGKEQIRKQNPVVDGDRVRRI